jgi:hypothetical protein
MSPNGTRSARACPLKPSCQDTGAAKSASARVTQHRRRLRHRPIAQSRRSVREGEPKILAASSPLNRRTRRRNRGPPSTRRPSVVPVHSFSGLMRTSSSGASAAHLELITGACLRSKPAGGVQRATKLARCPGASADHGDRVSRSSTASHRPAQPLAECPRRGPGQLSGSHGNRLPRAPTSRKHHARPECPFTR